MNCCLRARGQRGRRGGLQVCRGAVAFYTFVRVWGRHRETAGPGGHGMGPRAGGFGPPATAPPSQPRGRGLSPARDPQVCRGAMWGGERGEAAGPTSPSLSHSPLAGNQVPTRRATSSPGLAWGGTPARGPPQGHAGGPGMPFGGGMPVFANACVPLPAWHVFSWSCSPAACCSSPSPATAPPSPAPQGAPSTRYAPAPAYHPPHRPSTLHQPPPGTALVPPPRRGVPGVGLAPLSLHGQAMRRCRGQQA